MPGLLVIVILLRLLLLGVIVQVGIVRALIILITIALVVLIIALSVVIIGCILVTTAIRAILILLILLWCRLWVVIDSLLLLCGRHRVILVNDRKSMKLAIATSLILEDGRCLMAFSVD